MKLLVDIGNTRVKWASADAGRLTPAQARAHDGDLSRCFERAWGSAPAPSRVVTVCVAGPAREAALSAWVERNWGLQAEILRATTAVPGLDNEYSDPSQLGVDRWAAVVAAYTHAPGQACCVVDCGSAATIDFVDAAGAYRGGVIVPGLQLMRRSLATGTASLPEVADAAVVLPGRDTAGAIATGTLLGLAALVDGLVGRMTSQCPDAVLFLTGGDAAVLLPYLARAYCHRPDLVLEGADVLSRGTER